MTWYSIESRTRKYVNVYGFSSIARKHKKQLSDTVLDSLKTPFKKVVHKTGGFLESIFPDTVTNSYDDKIVKTKPVEEIIIQPEKTEKILNELRQVLQKWNIIKY